MGIYSIKKIVLSLLVFYIPVTFAGFLDIPEITETPTLKRESMLRDIDIPSVRDRDPDPESGPRLAVAQFRLQGIVEFPEMGITRKEINKLIEGIRADLMEEYKLLDSGYTQAELAELSTMLVEIEEEVGERHVTPVDVQKLVWLIRSQRSKRGITLGKIETVADKITQFYRERGFILAKAYIPRQEVRDGIVTLTLLLGVLGEVNVEGQKLYREDLIASVFDDSLAKPVTSDAVEENLYLINDYPGISVHGFFEPGAQVGDTKLNIKTSQEQQYAANVRADNHGTEQTGETRLYGDFYVNNGLGIADQFHVALLNSFSPDNTFYAQIDYSMQLFSPRDRLLLMRTKNQFVLGPGNAESIDQLALSGETNMTNLSYAHIFKRSRASNHSAMLTMSKMDSLMEAEEGGLGDYFDDEVENISLQYDFDVIQEEQKILHQGYVKLTSGKFTKNPNQTPEQDTEFQFLNLDYTMMTFWKVPFFDAESRLISRSSLQFASSPLSSINQFNIAGPTRVRAYEATVFIGDDAFYTGIEWIFNPPEWFNFNLFSNVNFKRMAQPFLFWDFSAGKQKKLNSFEKDQSAELMDIGIGLKFSYLYDFNGNIQLAFPLHNDFSAEDVIYEDQGVKLIFDFQYNFL